MTITLATIDALDNAIRNWGANLDWPAEHVARLLLAAVAGGLVGIEREVRGRQAGFRTNLLVAVGSALVMIVSITFAERSWPHATSQFNVNIDPARIAYGIMTGIGFLGAGTIVKHGASVQGLTTAAGLWCVAAIGMAAGFGMYTLTAIATAILVGALWLLDYVTEMLPKRRYRMLVIRRPWRPGALDETVQRVEKAGLKVADAGFDRSPDHGHADISLRVSFMDPRKYHILERQLEQEAEYELLAVREQ